MRTARTPLSRVARSKTKAAPTILVVDDEEDIREAIAWELTCEGYDVRTARNGREAIRQLSCGRLPDAILLDLVMPDMSGWSFRAELLKDPALAAIPLILASGAPSIARDAKLMGAAMTLPKPFDLDRLLGAVEIVTAPWALQRAL